MPRLTALALAFAVTSAAHADTMPQLDPAHGLLVAQLVWGAVIFAVFYLLVSRWGLPRVGAVLALRAGTIAADLERAHNDKADADAAVAELTAARREAYAKSQAAIAEAAARAKAEAAARLAEQESRLDAQTEESEARIGQARVAAMGALHQVSTETASAVMARLTDGFNDEHRLDQAVRDLLAERGLAA